MYKNFGIMMFFSLVISIFIISCEKTDSLSLVKPQEKPQISQKNGIIASSPNQIILINSTQPDSSGKICYTIGVILDSCLNLLGGDYEWIEFDDQSIAITTPINEFLTINNIDYGIFKINDYNRLLYWTYARGGDWANIEYSGHFSSYRGILETTFKDGNMFALNKYDNYLPGESGDGVLRFEINNSGSVVYVNFNRNLQGLNWPWISYGNENKKFEYLNVSWQGGTGWGKINIPIPLQPRIFLKYGYNTNNKKCVGDINKSMYYSSSHDAIVIDILGNGL